MLFCGTEFTATPALHSSLFPSSQSSLVERIERKLPRTKACLAR